MAVEIKVIERFSRGAEVSFDVIAELDGEKMFAPGAIVTRDRMFRTGDLRVSVSWASASNDKGLVNAKAQLQVLTKAIDLAERLDANAVVDEMDERSAKEAVKDLVAG
ncbi:MAG: hypothetical protein ACOYB2_10395 [Limnohabitans sp.]